MRQTILRTLAGGLLLSGILLAAGGCEVLNLTTTFAGIVGILVSALLFAASEICKPDYREIEERQEQPYDP